MIPAACTRTRCSTRCSAAAQASSVGQFQRGLVWPARGRSCRVKAHVDADAINYAASILHDASYHAHVLYTLADDATTAVAETAATAAKSTSGGGPFDLLADGFEAFLKFLDERLESAGVPYSYGFSIILLTMLVKLATFPLSKKQVESSLAMQALQPRLKSLQARYKDQPEQLQVETARLYRDAGVNPLAGCLPALATIPVFVGLYRALTKAADDGLLDASGFFWIPSLAGPTSIAARQSGAGLSWLFPLQDGAPPVGWHDAAAYLVLPVLLVVSQFVSQKVISPPQNTQDPSAAQATWILKLLPLMIGWFSLNVPSGLTLYWFVNNIFSTAQQLYLKGAYAGPAVEAPAAPSGAARGGTVVDVSATTVAAPGPKPAAEAAGRQEEGVRKLTGKELGSRKKKKEEGDDGRGNKFRALKAREAALRAATLAQQQQQKGGAQATESSGSATQVAVEEGNVTTMVEHKLTVPDAPPPKN